MLSLIKDDPLPDKGIAELATLAVGPETEVPSLALSDLSASGGGRLIASTIDSAKRGIAPSSALDRAASSETADTRLPAVVVTTASDKDALGTLVEAIISLPRFARKAISTRKTILLALASQLVS